MPRLQNVSWDELIAEFPPLWDPQDLCFGDRHVRNQCRQQLLEKANLLSSVPISMEGLRRRLRNVNKRLRNGRLQETNDRTPLTRASRPSQPTSTNPDSTQSNVSRPCLRELILEYPCLWNPHDVNYTNELIKRNCEEQLLVKYNNLSTSRRQITMSELQQKLQDLGPPGRPEPGRPTASKPETRTQPRFKPLEDLAAEYPCLWDPKDPGYGARIVKTRCLRQLMDKYNSQSTYRVTYSEIKTMIQSMIRRRRRRAAARVEDPRDDSHSDLGNSSDSTDQTNLNQTAVMSLVFHCCAVCGEIKSESLNNTNKPYMENNKTTLAINNLSVELNFDKDATVCLNCDMKLKEMHDFVKFVNDSQDKMKGSINADVITVDDDNDDNDDHKLIIDSLTVTDTEIVRPTVSYKRKVEETPELKKKCRVTIDLNTCDDDIAKYRMLKNDGIPFESSDTDDALNVTDTGYGEDINFRVKEEIEDDVQKDVDEFGDITDDDKSENIVSEHAHDIGDAKQKEADTLKEVESSKIVTQEEKINDIDGNEVVSKDETRNDIGGNEVVSTDETRNDVGGNEVESKDETRNGIMNEHTSESEISAAASIVNALASKEPVCVMPKSELIGLVESIVSRMMSK